ncbi:SDR family NAD(P)-dependent oxidoreductase [Thermogemmatispora sp.]|uniref:SDR family NAD(P)-dependent oxidoreductase n=1 Tax=Thermogemmatispora sp. TaxID=1968838 RepID=UPI001D6AE6C3|nr:SDR family NAD(P)-dependent oxidoreductase [Thermogemmatispora sp.]MBX5450146.1 SDR family NAD(P)-dependent oxidoreductase [Thermogemmatispora sp.]
MSTTAGNATIVITGCSSGFGRITALHLAQRGWQVFATVRREVDAEQLVAEAKTLGIDGRLIPVQCDITDAAQVKALGERVASATPRLTALLNNAGTAFAGPLELIDLDDLRAQFEVNTIAHIGVTQALLPLLKEARGTIINVSSVNGRIPLPALGPYGASKFALEALSDSLRIELAPFGVRVVVIEPTSSPTGIWRTSLERARSKLEQYRGQDSPYERLLTVMEKSAMHLAAGKGGFPPELFAQTVEKILRSSRPRTRYAVPSSMAWAMRLRYWLPDRFWDWQIRRSLRW